MLHDELVKGLIHLSPKHELYFGVFFLLIYYIFPFRQFIIYEFFHSIPLELEYIPMVRP
jgi:hypothetical protein